MAKHFDKDGNELKVDQKTDDERKAAFEAICKKAILVNMTRKQISNIPFDVVTSKKCADWLGVKDSSMIQVRKFLFNPERLSKPRSLINDALLMVWNHTRPWDNIGYRLLPMEYYDDFNETFGKIKDEFEEAVKEFIDNYDTYLAESKKLLGKAYNKADYPDKAQLTQFFSLDIHTSKFPDIDDIRLNLSGPELMAMQTEITEKYDEMLNSSVEELFSMFNEGIVDDQMAFSLIETIEKMNEVVNNAEIELKLTEARQKLKYMGVKAKTTKKPEEDDDAMMVMDDVDGLEDVMDDYI
jgi:hypothetical protein